MANKRKEFIKLNLNKERKAFIELRGINLELLKEFLSSNVLPLTFIGSLLILILTIVYYFTLSGSVNELKNEISKEKSKKERLLSEIKRLEELKKTLETKKAIYEVVKIYNDMVIKILENPVNLPYGYSLQNFSLCAFRFKNCDIQEKLNKDKSFSLDKPIAQLDLVLFNRKLENYIPPDSIRKFTYVVIDNLPYRRVCIEPDYERLLAEKGHRKEE
ncbi:hypothetical protein [Aquifex aeolicus]|uniref:Uncharacterized protein aq_2145 n=1 Tax=Aquifex aeolicus (strain VF5) TaxID=224324 RepID=Y2145_AQUAE|nr:hypothetical protein [Aquifex aeolicus]O67901.1 RecName: Full=Uncharacterized protein aq_2145 [Aquifex aeolicus VF5]AAC07872.1 putative protein [Aquifex aeolicus VF5]